MTETKDSFYAVNRNAWRKWLKKNHVIKNNIHLIFYRKHSGIKCPTYEEAVEEALCFGWIDSTKRKRDSDSSYLYFSKRKKKSNWSNLNKVRVAKLSKQKLMTPAGQAMITLAKSNGSWNSLDSSENLLMPPDLKIEFVKNKIASKNFNAFPPGARKIILAWIYSAKQEVTRKKRIEETVTLAAKNIRANQFVPKK